MMSVPVLQTGVGANPAVWGEFVSLVENDSALLAARRLVHTFSHSRRNNATPNPLVLHGPSGVGKTALAQTIVRKIIDSPAGHTVQVVAAGDLLRTQADQPEPDEFADMRTSDLLVLEDVQHLQVRAAGDLCLLLDDRCSRSRPTVLTANVGPAALTRFPRRLTSRLAAGLVVQLEPLTPAGRRALLERFATKRNMRLTDDALDWLAAQATGGGARPLVGVLEKLRTLAVDQSGPLTAAVVRELLEGESPARTKGIVDVVVAKVATAFGVSVKDVRGTARQRTIMLARQVAMYLTRHVTSLSFPQIAAAFGGRDHTTVLHACTKITAALKDDAKLRRTVRELKAELK
ncbi:helix-turn-helix domain-containing protein [Fimbriiglobus ruber]|uniref:Chromosomal replication initiator protein DnaA n=1 Tax=Fimbriiglobus ruber TaxID=1908690 RepID=A0A225EA04_9BACT|nr:helix-turn-helix domain-containing protein [Fimbriiglobus ruber]OWK45395.1 Chromosomal replication initiator protein DnaA [Fimbriiglobus ruber]